MGNSITSFTSTEEDMGFSGMVEWDGAGDYWVIDTGTFKILRGGTCRVNGTLVTFLADQATSAIGANTTIFAYINSSGTLQSTTSRTDLLFSGNTVLFTILYDGTNYVVVKEDHDYEFNANISNYLHGAIGTVVTGSGADITRVATGGGGAAGDRQLKIVGADILKDHGIDTTIADSGGAAVSFVTMYTNGAGKWVRYSNQTEFPGYYNSAGTATILTADNRAVFRLYVSKDSKNAATPTYYAVMHTAQFVTLALARTAISDGVANATNEFELLELAQLGYIIVHSDGGGYIEEVLIQKSVLQGVSASQAAASLAASLVYTVTTDFNGALSATDTSVQTALETLDDAVQVNTAASHAEAHSIVSHNDTTATGTELETLTDGSNADALHAHAGGAHDIASHSDTTATGTELETLTDGSDADALHAHAVNDTHRTSNGTDHSYIDQSVVSASSPTLDGTNFTGIPASGVEVDGGVETLDAYLTDITANGFLDITTITDAGGIDISWVAGNEAHVEGSIYEMTTAGSPYTLTDNSINYMYAAAGGTPTTFKFSTSAPADAAVRIIIYCEGGDIIAMYEEPLIRDVAEASHNSLDELHSEIIVSGMEVEIDADGTNANDFTINATSGSAVFYTHSHIRETYGSTFYSAGVGHAATEIERYYHASGSWTEENANGVDFGFWDNGTDKTAVSGTKWYTAWVFWEHGNTRADYVYPQTEHANQGAAEAEALTYPPYHQGTVIPLAKFIFRGNASAFGATAFFDDIRPSHGGSIVASGVSQNVIQSLSSDSGTITSDSPTYTATIAGGTGISTATAGSTLTITGHAEAHSIASHNDTTATGTELETLTDGSDADALHAHVVTDALAASAMQDLIDDTTPQLYAALDTNENDTWIDSTYGIRDESGNEQLIFTTVASAITYLTLTNAITGTAGPILKPGGETNVDLQIGGIGTGVLKMLSDINMDTFTLTNFAASLTEAGIQENGTTAEIDTATSDTLTMTPNQFNHSDFGASRVALIVVAPTTDVTNDDGLMYLPPMPASLDGWNLISAQAAVITAGTTNATTIDIYNLTQTADMLSGAISIASGDTLGTPGTVDAAEDDITTNDVLRVDCTTVSTTAPKGLNVILVFRKP